MITLCAAFTIDYTYCYKEGRKEVHEGVFQAKNVVEVQESDKNADLWDEYILLVEAHL